MILYLLLVITHGASMAAGYLYHRSVTRDTLTRRRTEWLEVLDEEETDSRDIVLETTKPI